MSNSATPPLSLGPVLRRWRVLHRMKQVHAAERFGVSQSTISRWESGLQPMAPQERAKVEAIVSARLDAAADRMLAELVGESGRSLHLICDLTHRLLALSRPRAWQFGASSAELLGASLWPFATAEIEVMETTLADRGWYDRPAAAPVEFETGANGSEMVPIWESRCRWTRFVLSDGTPARLVETLVRRSPLSRPEARPERAVA